MVLLLFPTPMVLRVVLDPMVVHLEVPKLTIPNPMAMFPLPTKELLGFLAILVRVQLRPKYHHYWTLYLNLLQ